MLNSIKNMVVVGLIICLAQSAIAQVRFNLSLLPDQRTYLVSMLPDQSWSTPMNAVGSAQIVLQYKADKTFLAGQIKSLISGISWSDNAYIEKPAAAPESNFICFALNERGTKNISFLQGVETPLFTFVNLEPECAGVLELVDNNNPKIQAVVQNDQINITQNMTVLGARGNAFTGILNGSVDCTVLSTVGVNSIVKNLRVYPVPATDVLQLFWENMPGNAATKLLVADMLGQQKTLEILTNTTGEQHLRLDVASFPTGLYTACLINTTGEKQSFRFVVIRL